MSAAYGLLALVLIFWSIRDGKTWDKENVMIILRFS